MDAAPSKTNARIKSTARIAIGIAITVVTLYVVYRDADPQQMLDAIGEFNVVMLLPFGLFYAVQLWAKTERWAQLLDRGTVKLRILFSSMMVGYTVNTLLPARLGEVARIYLLHKRAGIPAGRTLSTIILERLLDVATVVIILGIALLSVDLPNWIRTSILLGTILLIVGLAGLLVIAYLPRSLFGSFAERAPVLQRIPFKAPSRPASRFLWKLQGRGAAFGPSAGRYRHGRVSSRGRTSFFSASASTCRSGRAWCSSVQPRSA